MNEQEMEAYIEDNDIQFIRLTFFDVFGEQRNTAIMPEQLERAMAQGIVFDASAIPGFCCGQGSDLFLEPDLSTMSLVPWRSLDGGVVRILCDITHPDGTPYQNDTRRILKEAVADAKRQGICVEVGTEVEFYIFKSDAEGNPTREPHDTAGYLSVAPRDRGENFRRDICQMLRQMDIIPESSHHEQGPGQHEVDFVYADPLSTADNAQTFKWIVENAILLDGCHASFLPKPLRDEPGNGAHINISLKEDAAKGEAPEGMEMMDCFLAGVLAHIREMTLFLNPTANSYERLGTLEAPGYISWSKRSRMSLVRIPETRSGKRRFELRSPDAGANPYLAYALVIRAGLDGIAKKMSLPEAVDENLHEAGAEVLERLKRLPVNLEEAIRYAKGSEFIRSCLPESIIRAYCEKHD